VRSSSIVPPWLLSVLVLAIGVGVLGHRDATVQHEVTTLQHQVTTLQHQQLAMDEAALAESAKLQREINAIGLPCNSPAACSAIENGTRTTAATDGGTVCTAASGAPCLINGTTDSNHALLEVTPSPSTGLEDLFMVTDQNGAPICWVMSVGGLECGSDSGIPFDGAITSGTDVFHRDAAITPQGTLVLQPCGLSTCTSTLTAADIAEIHMLERSHITAAELRKIIRETK
jgi:hypothetical protein